MFKEDIQGAIDSYKKAVDYCQQFILGNERLLASTYFTIGCCYQQIQNNAEAGTHFELAVDAFRACLIKKLNENNQPTDPTTSNEKLVQPSIFDIDEIKELKDFLKELLEKLLETQQQEKINQQL